MATQKQHTINVTAYDITRIREAFATKNATLSRRKNTESNQAIKDIIQKEIDEYADLERRIINTEITQ